MLWKYYKNIVNVTLFLKFLPRFRQQIFFFSSHFRQWHCHNSIQFFSIFGNAIATITKKKNFFFFPISAIALPQLLFFSTQAQDGQEFGQRNFGNSVAEIPLLSLSPFCLSLSYFCWISVTLLPKFFLFPQFLN